MRGRQRKLKIKFYDKMGQIGTEEYELDAEIIYEFGAELCRNLDANTVVEVNDLTMYVLGWWYLVGVWI